MGFEIELLYKMHSIFCRYDERGMVGEWLPLYTYLPPT